MSQVIDAHIDGNSHVFFVRGDRTAIVDTGAPGNERNILRALRSAGIPREQVSVIVITHAHWDHCGSLNALNAALKVPVIAGWPDADHLEKGENVPVMNLSIKAGASGPKFDALKADVIIREDTSLLNYGIDARVVTTPGHTVGSLSVLASNGDCATGDFLASLFTGPSETVEHSLKKLIDGGAKRFYPSHGGSLEASTVNDTVFSPEK
jgi:hydroxyacylglutathione hydrolase